MEEIKEAHEHSHKKVSIVRRVRENPWIMSTVVLGIFVLIMLIGSMGVTGNVISGNDIGPKAVDFVNSELLQGSGEVTLSSVSEEEGFYKVLVDYNGQDVPIYFTKNGYYMGSVLLPLDSASVTGDVVDNTQTQDVPKSDKPVVELFVMSHCPYGTQAEKGLLPVLNLLGDKVDFNLRFVYYAMHPSAGEVEEQLRQYCIQDEQEDKFNDYLECFLEEGDSSGCLTEAGIDKTKMNSCYNAVDKEFGVLDSKEDTSSWLSGRYPLFNVDKALNDKYGVAGSPTLVINGVTVSSGRSPAAMLDAICSSFSDGNIPEECGNQNLPTDSYVPGFGWTLSTGSTTEGAQCY